MRILILATDIYTRGGIARYSWALASALGEHIGAANVDALVLLGSNHPPKVPEQFRIVQTIATNATLPAKVRYTRRALALGRTKYDLVICTHVALAPVAWLIRSLYRTPYWIVCHGIEAWRRIPPGERQSLTNADLVLPISRFTADKVREVNGVPAAKTKILYNAIDDEFANRLLCPNGSGSSLPTASGNKRIVLSVGMISRHHSYKGIDNVIKALPKVRQDVPNVRYIVVGSGDNMENLRKLAIEQGVGDCVEFEGEVTDEILAARYLACDVFVLPSQVRQVNGQWQGEGFGRVYAEAALAGKPVVGSRQGGAAEAVQHGATGLLVDPESITEIADALITLLKSPELSAQMGSSARQWATANFTAQAVRGRLAELLSPFMP